MYGCTFSIFLLILFFIIYILFCLYYHYNAIKLDLYVTKHRRDIIDYLKGSDLDGFDKYRVRIQRKKQWLYGNIGEEDETIRYYKHKLKKVYRVDYLFIALFCILFILLLLLCVIL